MSAHPFGHNPSISLLVSPLVFPGTLMSTTALTSLFSSILCMCPYQRSLIYLTSSCILVTPSSFLMSTLFTLSLSVTPLILRNILISVFSRICSSFILSVQHSALYRRRDLNHFPFITMWSIWLLVLPSGYFQVSLWKSRCAKMVPPITQLLFKQTSNHSPFTVRVLCANFDIHVSDDQKHVMLWHFGDCSS